MSSLAFIVRAYEEHDEAQLVALWNAVLPSTASHNDPLTWLRQKRAHELDLLWVAERAADERMVDERMVDERIVGAIMAGYDGHRGWLYSLAVHASAQR